MESIDEGRTLLFSIIEHCFAKKKKKELNRLAFLLESVNFIIVNNRFTVVFNNDQ